MFDLFTDTSRRAVAYANQETLRLRGNIIGEAELLLGIVIGEQGIGHRVLRLAGIDLDDLANQLRQQPRAKDDGSAPQRLPQTPEFRLAIEAAVEIGRELNHRTVTTGHMLLGLLRYREFASTRLLAARGLTYDEAAKTIAAMRGAEIDSER